MILEYSTAGLGDKTFKNFVDIIKSGLKLSDYTFTDLISANDSSIALGIRKQLHGLVVKYGFTCVKALGNALITMYGHHKMVKEAESLLLKWMRGL